MMTMYNVTNPPVWFIAEQQASQRAQFGYVIARNPGKPYSLRAGKRSAVVVSNDKIESIEPIHAVVEANEPTVLAKAPNFTDELFALSDRIKLSQTSADLEQFDNLIAEALAMNRDDQTPVKQWAAKLAKSVFGR